MLLEQRAADERTAATTRPALVAISHGTSSPIGQRAVASLVSAVAVARGELVVSGGFVDVQQPDVEATLDSLDGDTPAIVVPLLLSAGYHVHVDLRDELAVAGRPTALTAALGPDDRLVTVLRRRLVESGLRPGDGVVLACAGSSDARAVADCHEMGARLSAVLGVTVRVGFISAASPRLAEAVELERATSDRVVVSTYLLAPGYFDDLAHSTAADVATPPLLAAGQAPPPELVELVIDRYEAGSSAF
ncbi:sirohydrochlorin chelatase [Conyzicola sp.]|uniref:sirohydrochlorin chelatase n=1 Tax=Conyzicola sp. TaxID=1969404 RepID=UPI003988F5AC